METDNKKLEEDFEAEMPFVLSGLKEREEELDAKIESGEITCDIDDDHCENCGS